MSKESSQLLSILFSDVKGYSKINDDKLYSLLRQEMIKIESEIFNVDSIIYKNTWGDAFFVCCHSVYDLAEMALKLRDFFKNTNWKRKGFSINLSIRIGLHIQEVKVIKDTNNIVVDVIGKRINTTARIEPIVNADEVYCSKRFYDHLMDEESINIKGLNLGTKSLAKEFGDMDVYKLSWDYEKIDNNISLSMPKIKRTFSDKEKMDFINNAFSNFKAGFKKGLKKLENEYNLGANESGLAFTPHFYQC